MPAFLLYISDPSIQAPSRHRQRFTYRCFLPDLTRFMRLPCARPKYWCPIYKEAFPLPYHLFLDKKMAESERFELSVQYHRTHAFQACSFNHSDNSPHCLNNKKFIQFVLLISNDINITTNAMICQQLF